MRMLNYLILIVLVVCATTVCTACHDHDKSDEGEPSHVIRSNDELQPSAADTLDAPQRLKNSINVLTNEINNGFDDITSFEQMLDSIDVSQLPQRKRAKLRNNILLAKNAVQEKRSRLNELENDLDSLDEQSKGEMAQSIKNLRQQLDLQKARIDHLSAKLHTSPPQTKVLIEPSDSTEVSNQPPEATQISPEEEIKQKEQREMLNNEFNECYYVIGTKDELENHKIVNSEFLNKTKVMQSGNLLAAYFIKADKRTLNEITINNKNVTVLTKHDQLSYSVNEVGDTTVIRILDVAMFWEYSNYLVVLIE